MPTSCIPFRETGYFSGLICDYVEENKALQAFYRRFPRPGDFKPQLREKSASFPQENRDRLSEVLREQYQHIDPPEITLRHIEKLREARTFTVTTGHQLNIFTGPLYFIYKIISTINLARHLQHTYPHHHFVPVYWMATEDHDFEEISHFTYRGETLRWQREATGAVGELSTEGLETVFHNFERLLGKGTQAEALKKLFKNTYVAHSNLTEATRYLVNELFGDYGLVIVDAHEKRLKDLFIPCIKEELLHGTSYQKVSDTIAKLNALSGDYTVQVQPRECNLFYLKPGLRERIIKKDNRYYINDTGISFTEKAILNEVDKHPERFSPNVIMRPLYQEVILPNLCYIGGGGEIAYWLELKDYFEASGIPFPILMLRNSALVLTEKQAKKLEKLHLSRKVLFSDRETLINDKVREISDIPIDLSPQKNYLQQQFKGLYDLAEKTDRSFLGAVKAQEKKQLNGLEKLEKRLLKAQKRKEAGYVNRITLLHQALFPDKKLQERSVNFSELYMAYGDRFIPMLMEALDPFKICFLVMTL